MNANISVGNELERARGTTFHDEGGRGGGGGDEIAVAFWSKTTCVVEGGCENPFIGSFVR